MLRSWGRGAGSQHLGFCAGEGGGSSERCRNQPKSEFETVETHCQVGISIYFENGIEIRAVVAGCDCKMTAFFKDEGKDLRRISSNPHKQHSLFGNN